MLGAQALPCSYDDDRAPVVTPGGTAGWQAVAEGVERRKPTKGNGELRDKPSSFHVSLADLANIKQCRFSELQSGTHPKGRPVPIRSFWELRNGPVGRQGPSRLLLPAV